MVIPGMDLTSLLGRSLPVFSGTPEDRAAQMEAFHAASREADAVLEPIEEAEARRLARLVALHVTRGIPDGIYPLEVPARGPGRGLGLGRLRPAADWAVIARDDSNGGILLKLPLRTRGHLVVIDQDSGELYEIRAMARGRRDRFLRRNPWAVIPWVPGGDAPTAAQIIQACLEVIDAQQRRLETRVRQVQDRLQWVDKARAVQEPLLPEAVGP